MKTVALILSTLFFTMHLTACSTVEGIGKDIKTAGEKLEEKAKENK